jgi:hypothetical protein
MRSFIMIAEAQYNHGRCVTINTDAEIGEVRPLKKKHIKATPKKSGSYNSRKILNGNFSFGIGTIKITALPCRNKIKP